MTVKQVKNNLNKIGGILESIEYDFHDPKNEDAALEVMVLTITCLNEIENIIERDDAYKQYKKND